MSERWEIIWCPLCGEVVHRHNAMPIVGRVAVSSRASTDVTRSAYEQLLSHADELHEQEVLAAEKACVQHLETRHPIRYRLWQRFRRDWLVTRGLRRSELPKIYDVANEYQVFEPRQIITKDFS